MNNWIWIIAFLCSRFVEWLWSFSPSERVALFSAFLVLLGVIGEEIVELKRLEDEKWDKLKKAIKRWSIAVLILGLAGDALGIVMGKAEMAAITKTAGDASASARDAKNDAADAKESAVHAKTAETDLETKLRDTFGARQFSPAKSKAIIERLRGLGGIRIDVFILHLGHPYIANEDDAPEVGAAVVRLLRRGAHVDSKGWLVSECHGAWAENFDVGAVAGATSKEKAAALRVLNAFRFAGIGAYPEVLEYIPQCDRNIPLSPSGAGHGKPDAHISIMIESKTQPILGP